MKNKIFFAAYFLLCISNAHAVIVNITGDVVVIDPPTSVALGDFQDITTAYIFSESTSVVYDPDTWAFSSEVDHFRGIDWFRSYYDSDFPDLLVPNSSSDSYVSIASGTLLDSYFLHFEPVPITDGSDQFYTAQGSITFDEEILGVLWGDSVFVDINSYYLKNPSTQYDKDGDAHGLLEISDECGNLVDTFSVSDDSKRLNFCFTANGSSDQLRIVTASKVPAPTTLALITLGLLGFTAMRRRLLK